MLPLCNDIIVPLTYFTGHLLDINKLILSYLIYPAIFYQSTRSLIQVKVKPYSSHLAKL